MKLTKIQIEILHLLDQGKIMVVDKMNLTSIEDRDVQFQTREFLAKHRLITRLDKTKAVTVHGNGFVLSERGKEVLSQHAKDQKSKDKNIGTKKDEAVDLQSRLPTKAQLAKASELGLNVPTEITSEELSSLISLTTWRDKKAEQGLMEIATRYGVPTNKYSGKKFLFTRIFDRLTVQGKELDLAAWFTYRVYRELVGGKPGMPITSPFDKEIQVVAAKLADDSAAIQSIRRYDGEQLIWFGQWTSPDGVVHQGSSNRTLAYERAVAYLRSNVSIGLKSSPIKQHRIFVDESPSMILEEQTARTSGSGIQFQKHESRSDKQANIAPQKASVLTKSVIGLVVLFLLYKISIWLFGG